MTVCADCFCITGFSSTDSEYLPSNHSDTSPNLVAQAYFYFNANFVIIFLSHSRWVSQTVHKYLSNRIDVRMQTSQATNHVGLPLTNPTKPQLIPAGVSGFFIDIKSFRSHYDPGVDSISNRNEYQEHFLGVKSGRCVRLTALSPSCAVVTKSGSLNLLAPELFF